MLVWSKGLIKGIVPIGEHTISFGDRLNEIYNFVIYTKQSENVIKFSLYG